MESIMKPTAVIASPLGKLGLAFCEEKLSYLCLMADDSELLPITTSYGKQIIESLALYFKNPHHAIKPNYHLNGSSFQLRIWQALQNIPCGQTLTYGELAKQLKTSPRAVGQACKTNPIPILIPCHRVVAANGAGGYAGKRVGRMLDMKLWLLEHEKK
jgi:methylated-DNA-[protein]-cysteine S-methyltransferase